MTSNHNYECFNGGCHGMAANGSGICGEQKANTHDETKYSIFNLKLLERWH